ncbi:MAG TPA: DUF4446 family protein [Candidatus Woesebacteria bacterium]|nr:DUF4446 family protein [Candidatus Woesebacteria bacterium]HRT39756.1 DUF4446 family protein [Candidatus Woesebacteria bacterium]
MDLLFDLLTLISFGGVIYLIFLFYRKDKQLLIKNSTDHADSLKIKLLRFNPFNDVGSNQSFTLCLLNKYNSGCLITSLHSRETTRIYAKEIIRGQPSGKNVLSKEEKECLQKAINNS